MMGEVMGEEETDNAAAAPIDPSSFHTNPDNSDDSDDLSTSVSARK